MAFIIHTAETSRFRQHLRNMGPGVPVTASEVKVYYLRKDGTRGRLLAIKPPLTFEESPKKKGYQIGKGVKSWKPMKMHYPKI